MIATHAVSRLIEYLRKVKNFKRWTRVEKACFLPAWFLLGMSRLVILSIPFRYLAPLFGKQSGSSPWIPLVGSRSEARAFSIGRTVRRAAGYTSWKSNCFAQALAAGLLLRFCGIPYSMLFGIARNSGEAITAHAWVAAGRVPVTGGVSFGQFTVVGCFVLAAR